MASSCGTAARAIASPVRELYSVGGQSSIPFLQGALTANGCPRTLRSQNHAAGGSHPASPFRNGRAGGLTVQPRRHTTFGCFVFGFVVVAGFMRPPSRQHEWPL